jgi:hypothetical protein
MNGLVCDAIRRRRLVEIRYHGAERLVEPYLHGVRDPRVEVLVCYQRSGGSKRGLSSGWKALHVDEIEALAVTDVPFVGLEPGFNPDGSSYNLTSLHCMVSL